MRAVRTLAFALVTTALGACATSRSLGPRAPDTRIADADLVRPPRAVTAPEALADLERAAYLFDQAYAGIDAVDAARVDAARRAIRSRPRWEPEPLARIVLDAFGRPDAHLAIDYGATEPLRAVAPPPAPAPVPGRAVELQDGEVPILSIRSFDNRHVAELSALPRLAQRLRKASAFVIDLRGNGGGNYAFAEAFVLALTDATLLRLGEREVVSIAAAEGRANAIRRQLASGLVPKDAVPHYVRHLSALERTARDLRLEGRVRTDVERPPEKLHGVAPAGLRGRGAVLVDEGCASACEMAVSLLRQVPGLVIAGRPTRGGMEVGEVAVFRLPASGLMISMGTRRFTDPFGQFAETRGFSPDVELAALGPRAIDEARDLARRGDTGSALASRAR